MADILNKQKQFLVEAISEAKRKEFSRIKRIQNTTSKSDLKQLSIRFEKERSDDQARIQHLTHDLTALKEKVQNGDLQKVSDYRLGKPSTERATDRERPNRFAGIEDYDQIVSGVLANIKVA